MKFTVKSIALLPLILIILTSIGNAKETINLHEIGPYYDRDRVVHVAAGLVVDSIEKVQLSTKIVTQDIGMGNGDCSGEREGTFCRNHYENQDLGDFTYNPETKLIHYGDRVCAKLKKRWFGRYIKMINGCKISVKRKRGKWFINLVLK